MSTPMYVSALWAAIRNRNIAFAVTSKGAVSGDRPSSFTKNLRWAALLLVALGLSVPLGNTHLAIRSWAVLTISVCLLPVVIWLAGLLRGRLLRPGAALPVSVGAGASGTRTTIVRDIELAVLEPDEAPVAQETSR
jgi:hypothetical protein